MYYRTMNEQVRAIDKLSKPMCPDRYSIEAKKLPDPQDYRTEGERGEWCGDSY